ncbi:MAG: hypothetical protein ABIJ09_24295 [Pseudomonadota bacterium]
MTSPRINPALSKILDEAYAPCPGFTGACQGIATWAPERGHVPRGFLGAFGDLEEVKLVLVVAEPGNPYPGDSHDTSGGPTAMVERMSRIVLELYQRGHDLYHRNMSFILDGCFPGESLVEQLRKVWITESYLCSAPVEGGAVPARACRECRRRFLERQIALLPGAVVATLGGKAAARTKGLNTVAARAISPPGCNHKGSRESWLEVIRLVRESAGK